MSTALVTVKEQLLATRPSFDEINLNGLSFNKELEFALQIFEKNDYLLKMSPSSLKNALVNIALSGLTLNPILRLAYLVPRKGMCCVDVSYQGIIKILTDTGSVKSIKSDVCYEKDVFDIELGSNGFVKHKPFLGEGVRGRKLGAYSIAVLNDGSEHIDFMRWDEIMAIKSRSESVKSGKQSAWDTDTDEMACKTVIKRHAKYLPKSERSIMAFNAMAFDDENNGINFANEAKKNALDTLDDSIDVTNIPDEVVTALATALTKKEVNEIYTSHPELHQYIQFQELGRKRKAEIDIAYLQQKKAEEAAK